MQSFSASGPWISTDAFAQLAGISVQAARKALRLGSQGKPWRGAAIRVRRLRARGGLAYQVSVASLPDELRPADKAVRNARQLPALRSTVEQDHVALRRWDTISTAFAHPCQSPDRAVAIAEAARAIGCSKRTLYRWLSQYEQHGFRGLSRARPSNAGLARVLVSRVFDRAFRGRGYSNRIHRDIAAELELALKGLWASRAEQAGSREVRRLAEFLLLEICERRGVQLPADALRLSRRYVERFSLYRVVNTRRNDRKAFDDAKPRIRRDWTDLAPMERIVADVKHLDVIVTRVDGSPAWPKIVAFMDAGTGRVFVHLVLLERGEGVRQEHVIEGFLAMVTSPNWGFPQGLYLDNGSEFGALAKIDGALQQLNEPGMRTLIYARPYNASAKPIESLFARLDRYVFSLLPGYAGSNRMAKKTQTIGKPPKPFPGSWDEFCRTAQDLITAHNQRPVGGQWADRSPDGWLQSKVATGWRSATVDPLALDAAFSDRDSRRSDRGVLKIGGQRFTHEKLAALPSRTTVDLALPWRRDAAPLAKLGEQWVYLQREQLFPARWIEGAQVSSRRQSEQSKYVSELARGAPKLDPVAAKIRWSKRQAQEQSAFIGTRLDLGSDVEVRGKAMAEELQSPRLEPAAADRVRAREMEITQRLERK
ncbi:MAG: helix-turn-helix domain-containing protein [Phenylobacterium sp.]|uniref:helix-turn-helix domain-containing protein n=1 Tax=Phenylobacterium sp. TaxID=1871053 RepID=UPI0027351FE1|nr:helix-turn-helix domain-containing protein [Phenylobacterium sp.]MDP3172820.1 helix-turn-helix domain-containing protein [Phenylobacterium sp.]